MMRRLLLTAAAVAVPAAAGAQTWRTLDVSRQLRDSSELHVHVTYGAGNFQLRAATTPMLYAMTLRYDEQHSTPVHRYDAAAGTLDIGLKNVTDTWRHHGSDNGNKASMQLQLAPSVPLDLTLTLGATDARIDLGGLAVRSLVVQSGAADERVDFSRPNRVRLGRMAVDVGAAAFDATNLANANASSLQVNGGVGAVDLGFGGTWTGDMEADIHVTLGKVTLHVPQDVGVQLKMQRFLTSFDNDGLVKRDGSYYTDNWDSAKYHLRVRVQTSLGGIAIDRFAGATQP